VKAFIVELENHPGALARLAAAMGGAGVNMTTGAGFGLNSTGAFAFLVDNEQTARAVLDLGDFPYRTSEVVEASVADRPGGLAEAAQRLADAGVNVDVVLPIAMAGGRMAVAFGVADADAAHVALKESS
jgi:hypothetical protein